MAAVLPLLVVSDTKWTVADDLPDRDLATVADGHWVTVSTQVPLSREDAFDCFVSGERYTEWLGVPVTIEDRRFAAELEWGTRVRGHYEVVAPPELIAMRWDFEDDDVPLPGAQLVGYLRFFPTDPVAGSSCTSEPRAPSKPSSSPSPGPWCSAASPSTPPAAESGHVPPDPSAAARGEEQGTGRSADAPDGSVVRLGGVVPTEELAISIGSVVPASNQHRCTRQPFANLGRTVHRRHGGQPMSGGGHLRVT